MVAGRAAGRKGLQRYAEVAGTKDAKVALKKEAMGGTKSIMVGPDGGTVRVASDPRSVDDLTAGY